MNNTVEIYFDEVLQETAMAYLIQLGEDETTWVPKSQCKMTEPNIVEMPEWLAIEKELV